MRSPSGTVTGSMWLAAEKTLTRIAALGEREGVVFCLENLNLPVDHPGTPFALAHTFGQTGPFRPSTLPRRGPENVVLAGSSVQPGVGVPMVLISGRLAAERITGAGSR